ncbi:alanine racemase [Aquimarina gracilis]|uniref:Alanine racemase n=1 Tax=Aquimarina gracilis TaxID=874422 RepID=A0ABU6A1F7_9FLAO|nr:alanine racemase [Aquimarina gracilis]MEB3347900.1 alanine racemase [Aquimarina gracilis]
MSSTKETVLEINLAHLTHNFNYLKSKIADHVKMLAVVKASGYGSDAAIIAKHLEKIGADYFAVAYASEGVILREAGVKIPILVLHPQPVNFPKLIEYKLEPSLYSSRTLREFIKIASLLGEQNYPIHIKFNTGLNRIGFWENDVDYIINQLNATNTVKIVSLLSHLAASEDPNEKEFTIHQINSFKKTSKELIQKLGYTPIMHQSNTSGILNYREAHFDMVRTGIGLYGYGNDAKFDKELKPVASLKSIISQIHRLEPGESVGYNRAFKATDFIKTATVPIGHADGISRQYGNKKGFVIINNQRAYILGNVCMDMIMVDITNIDCKEGDEVIIFDANSNAAKIAEFSGTISYELLTAVSPRVKRTVIEEN